MNFEKVVFPASVNAPADINADFAYICRGDSMINARIFDGDTVFIRQQETVQDGEIAAAIIGGVAYLRRVWFQDDYIVLEPANPKYCALYLQQGDVRIIGKATAILSMIPEVKE